MNGATFTLDGGQVLMFIIVTLVGIVIYNERQQKERLAKRVDDLEKYLPAAIEKTTKPIWDKFDIIESRLIGPLTTAMAEVQRSVSAVGSDVRAQISELKLSMSQNHPDKKDFATMRQDLDRIAERLVPHDLLEIKQPTTRRQR